MNNYSLERRQFLRLSGAGLTVLLSSSLVACQPSPSSIQSDQSVQAEATSAADLIPPASPTADHDPDLEIALRAVEDTVGIIPDQATAVWRYLGEVIDGEPDALATVEDSYLGPTIRVCQGQRVRIHFKNDLPVPSGIHWHGLLVPEEMDGHPRHHVASGESYTYEFVVQNRAGTYWYHPHPDRTTGGQVYHGLAGLFIVSDEEEAALPFPRGKSDVALVLQDRLFDDAGQLVYSGNDPIRGARDAGFYGNGHTQSMGMSGNRILINGQVDYTLSVATRAYRLRILNGSNSRTYVLVRSDQQPLTVIGTDGGLLEAPVERPYVILGPAERVELWADFSQHDVGDELGLLSYRLGNGDPFLLARITIDAAAEETLALPEHLTEFVPLAVADAYNAEDPRTFQLGATRSGWAINGRTFELEAVADDERVQLGTTEVWEFINDGSAGGMLMPHPMHIHGVQFRVIERQMTRGNQSGWETIRAGYVDEGWKDTVTLMGGERAKVLMRFDAHAGLFLMHCHVLEHEDMSMMRNFRIDEQA